jgi:putative DNA primase/helicase
MMMFGNPLQVAVILQGPGGNGKSTFLRVLQALIGKANVSALSLRQITEDRFALAGLLGKTANLAGDIDSRYLGDSSRFKQVVGGDLVEVERKYGQPFSFEPYAVPVFSANEFWKTGDTTHGYWRRWLPIPFPFKVGSGGGRQLNEQDLFDETPGIFNRAMVGLRSLMRRGKFEKPDSVSHLFEQMAASADVMADWFDEDESIILNNPDETAARSPRTEVYEAFMRWCRHSGHKGMSSTSFYKRMLQLGYAEAKVRGTRNFIGLELAPFAQPQLMGSN